MRAIPLVATALTLATFVPAQVGRNEWIASTFTDYISSQAVGGLWHVDAARTTATFLSNQSANAAAANCVVVDELGLVFYGTLRSSSVSVPNPGEIMRVVVSGTTVVSETVLTAGAIDTGSISGITLRRDQIWFVTDAGNVGWIPKAGGPATIVLNLSASGVRGLGQSITTNGREIFVGTSHTASTPDVANVWMLDAENPTPTLTPVFFLGGSVFALSMGRDNMPLAGRVSGQLWSIDPLGLSGVRINIAATAPGSNCNGTYVNPWLNIVGNVPGYGSTPRQFGFYDVATNTWEPNPIYLGTAIPSGVGSSHEEPFFLFGRGCAGVNGLEPRMGWNGMPMQGQGFNLTLRNADPGAALLFLGLSDTVGPLGPLPFDLGVLGAPGCIEYTSTESVSVAFVDPNGNASHGLAVPANPALTGLRLHAQWAVISGANNFGMVASDAVTLNIR